jgi:hypothetical protein
MSDVLNFPAPVFRQATVNGPTGFTNPLLVSLPDLTGVQTDPQLPGNLHPAMMQYNFGTADAPDTMSGFASGSTLFYKQIEYFHGGTDMTGTRGGLRIHGAIVAPSPSAPNNTVGFGHLQEITTSLGGSAPMRPDAIGGQYAYNPIIVVRAAAQNIRASQGIEVDLSHEAGCSLAIRNAFSAVSFNNDAVRGTEHDSAFNVSAVGGAVGFGVAFAVTDVSTKFPLDTTSWVMQLISAGAHTIAGGIDLTGGGAGTIGISGPVFLTRHINMDGPTGNITTDGAIRAAGGIISDTNYLFVTYAPGANVVPTVGGASPVLNVSCGFNAIGDINFWNGEYTAGLSFDFRQITSAGISSSVAKFNTTTVTFPNSVTIGANKVIGARDTGWTAMTGSPDKATAYATGSVTLAQLAGRVAQLQASLTAHGLIGA